jgi:hypothetical protein
MSVLKYILQQQWGYITITGISLIISIFKGEQTWWVFIASLVITVSKVWLDLRGSRKQQTTQIMMRLKNLAEELRRFMPSSRYIFSVFYLARQLLESEAGANETHKGWAEGCRSAGDSLEGYLQQFITTLDLLLTHKWAEGKEIANCFTEFNNINNQYFRLAEALRNKMIEARISKKLEDDYNKFAIQYNEFVRNLKTAI